MATLPGSALRIDWKDFEQVFSLATEFAKNGPTQYIFWNGRNYNITMQEKRAHGNVIIVQSWR